MPIVQLSLDSSDFVPELAEKFLVHTSSLLGVELEEICCQDFLNVPFYGRSHSVSNNVGKMI